MYFFCSDYFLMIIYSSVPKSKAKKKPKPVRDQYAAWLESHKSTKKITLNKSLAKSGYSLTIPTFRQTPKYNSIDTGVGDAAKPATKVYTGTKVKGIATMHKSNAVPVFTDEEAVEISSMRR